VGPPDGGVIDQATGAITFAPHDGNLNYVFVSTSPMTLDEMYGRPPSPNGSELASKAAIIFGGGSGSTRVPLSNWPRALPPGRYYYNAWWTYQRSFDTCLMVLGNGACDPSSPIITVPVFASRYTAPRSFVIPPPASSPASAPAARPTDAARCGRLTASLAVNARQLRRARAQLRTAPTAARRRATRATLSRLRGSRARLGAQRATACRLV
jgi:hypothetical protein